MKFPIICLVTGGEGIAPGLIREAATTGVDLVQIRERTLDGKALVAITRQAVHEVVGTTCQIVVNDRFDVAMAARAAGVHLRADSPSASRLRQVAPPGFLIGRSVHSVVEAVAASREGGCDYLIFGTVFRTDSKPAGHEPAGLDALREVCRSTTLPVLAIGGISTENAADVIAVGARGVAAIGLFRGDEPIAPTISRLRRQFDT